ncbi:hypothetical protein Ddc_05036 [Ditylenchus destructor]|nr:hypothetical protein Ddc_05036 [Ditylenchus destructor]
MDTKSLPVYSATPALRRAPSKLWISLLAILQLTLSVAQLCDNTILISQDSNIFHYPESRYPVQLMWCLTIVWALSVIMLLFGVLSNRPSWIVLNLCLTAFFLVVMIIFVIILLHSSSDIKSIVLCAITAIVLAVSLFYGWKCFKEMKDDK